MRGEIDPQRGLFSYVDLEERIPQDHPIRKIKRVVDRALKALDDDFAGHYSDVGQSSIAPEMLLRAQFLKIFYSIRSERQLVERLDYDLLFRWFVGLRISMIVTARFTDHDRLAPTVDTGADNLLRAVTIRQVCGFF